nr:immunoglobulin heavy chain junction region [Macaca mulatta]
CATDTLGSGIDHW